MTVEEAIKYAEKKKLRLEEEIERPGSAYGAYAMHSTELEFVSMALSALRAQQQLESSLKVLESNAPLTLDELKWMDGEPVWVRSLGGEGKDAWAFVDADCEMVRAFVTRFSVKCMATLRHFKTYEKAWLAYRRKPEEV